VRDALLAAHGDRAAAASALGIDGRTLRRWIYECFINGERVAAWEAREWTVKGGRRSVAVADVEIDGRVRRYILDAHGKFARGEHVNRVPYVGVERERVVCHVCKEARSQDGTA
jgi:hypothetical protein